MRERKPGNIQDPVSKDRAVVGVQFRGRDLTSMCESQGFNTNRERKRGGDKESRGGRKGERRNSRDGGGFF